MILGTGRGCRDRSEKQEIPETSRRNYEMMRYTLGYAALPGVLFPDMSVLHSATFPSIASCLVVNIERKRRDNDWKERWT